MIGQWISTAGIIAIALFSMVRYGKLNSSYDRARVAVASDRSFAAVYKVLIALVLLISVAAVWGQPPLLLKMYDSDYLRFIGTLVSVSGALGFEACVRALGAQYSPCYDLRVPTRRVASGPYRWLAHPMYTSNVVILLGVTITSGSLWPLVGMLIVCIYYIRSASIERRIATGM